MNCLIDNIIFSLQKSGGISVVWQEHLKRLLQESLFDCVFIEYDDAEKNIQRKSINIPENRIELKSSTGIDIRRFVNIKSQYKSPHIFHSSFYRVEKSKHAHNITTVHDFTYFKFFGGIKRFVNCGQQFFAIKNSDSIICVSENTKRDLLEILPYVKEEKIHVIHNGVNSSYKPIDNSKYSLDLPFDDSGFILYVGSRSAEYKNFRKTVEVCSRINMPLVMAGGGNLSTNEIHLLKTYSPKFKFYLYPHLSNDQLNELYNRALALLYPSVYEGFGIPILEAQRAGCPVIAINTSSIPEVIGNSDLLLNDSSVESIVDAVKAIMTDTRLKNSEIQKGLMNSSEFSWEKTYEKTINLYKDILRRL